MTRTKELNIIICGVGGQGVVLMSELLGNAAVRENVPVLGSEVLGMAQRGGSVFSSLRLGGNSFAPLTPEGNCDILIACEPSEALRNIQYLARGGVAVLNTRPVIPYTVFLGKSKYPDLKAILQRFGQVTDHVVTLDSVTLAAQAGNAQSANVVMLGALFGTGLLPISVTSAQAAIRAHFAAKAVEINLKAFDLGYREIQGKFKVPKVS